MKIWTQPMEMEGAIPFEQDQTHKAYDAEYGASGSGGFCCRRSVCLRFFARGLRGR